MPVTFFRQMSQVMPWGSVINRPPKPLDQARYEAVVFGYADTYLWFTPWRVKPLTQMIRNYIFALLTTCINRKSLLNKLIDQYVAFFKCLCGSTSGNVFIRGVP